MSNGDHDRPSETHAWGKLQKFREIIELPVFSDLQYLSLSRLYQNFKKKHDHEK